MAQETGVLAGTHINISPNLSHMAEDPLTGWHKDLAFETHKELTKCKEVRGRVRWILGHLHHENKCHGCEGEGQHLCDPFAKQNIFVLK
jgi:hypothetical protein